MGEMYRLDMTFDELELMKTCCHGYSIMAEEFIKLWDEAAKDPSYRKMAQRQHDEYDKIQPLLHKLYYKYTVVGGEFDIDEAVGN